MSWSRYCIISEISRTFKAVPNTNPVVYKVTSQTINVKFQANNNKLYFLVVTVSINDNIKFLENIKEGLKRTIPCNKYRYKITTQTEIFFFFLIIWFLQRLEILIYILQYHSKIVILILREAKTYWNVKKWWLYNREFIRFFISS